MKGMKCIVWRNEVFTVLTRLISVKTHAVFLQRTDRQCWASYSETVTSYLLLITFYQSNILLYLLFCIKSN